MNLLPDLIAQLRTTLGAPDATPLQPSPPYRRDDEAPKACAVCGVMRPNTREFYSPKNRRADGSRGLDSVCKPCRAQRKTIRRNFQDRTQSARAN